MATMNLDLAPVGMRVTSTTVRRRDSRARHARRGRRGTACAAGSRHRVPPAGYTCIFASRVRL
jgi:hypothetical protein